MLKTDARRWALLAAVSAGLLLITLDNSILYTALPTLTADLGASSSESLWIINAYPLVVAGLLLGSGTLGDRIGHRRMFLIGLVVFGIASSVAALSTTTEVLIGARALLGVGAATMMPATLALIRVTFDDERERNFAIAVWGSVAIVGGALGPILGGLLLEYFWWGSVFLVNVPVVVVALVATVVVAPQNDPNPAVRWDFLSSVFALVGLSGLVYTIKEVAAVAPSWSVVLVFAVVAVGALSLFARRQGRLTQPLLDFSIFRNSAFAAGLLAAAMSMFVIAGIQLVTSQRYQLVVGFSPFEAGLLVAAIALGSFPTGLIGGAVLHRVGLLPLVVGGLAVALAGVVVVIFGVNIGLWAMITGFVVIGAGLGSAMSVASTAVIGNVPPRRAGMASSVEEVSYEFGSLAAVATLGSIVTALYSAWVQLPPDTPAGAGDSIAAAIDLAGDHNPALFDAAANAYDSAYVMVMVVIAGVLTVGTVATGILLRRFGPGSSASMYQNH
ncbi:MFS transporter [Rhodococcus sp. 05-339-2]|uniref:MFS transporter n=1 Tax=Rhodococcoides fascians TaxID=1828 RepID=UPI00050C88F8|nr:MULTISPECIES: MFS transporter [Rhodococcus]OZD81338.1 MFS transporter [Rhodococcus sp. 05-339-2]